MFGNRISPLTYQEVAAALKRLGYEMVKKKATAHEKWVLLEESCRRVVIVDKHIAPFDKKIIKLMARQAGLSPGQFHAICKKTADIAPEIG